MKKKFEEEKKDKTSVSDQVLQALQNAVEITKYFQDNQKHIISNHIDTLKNMDIPDFNIFSTLKRIEGDINSIKNEMISIKKSLDKLSKNK